jgi:hypothetical protein
MNESSGLFKYLSPDKIVFFEDRLVLLTPPVYLNDPWDFLPKGATPSEDDAMQIGADFASDEFLAAQGTYYQKEIGKVVGIVSLTEQALSRLMWAHYADSHRGFVAEFATWEPAEKYGFSIRMCAVGPVVAGKLKPVVAAKVKYRPDFQGISRDAANVQDICWSKHPDWGKEQEWRIIWPLQRSIPRTTGEGGRRFWLSFAPDGLVRVIFGMRMAPELKQRLCRMLDREEFKHVQKQMTGIDARTGEMVLRAM